MAHVHDNNVFQIKEEKNSQRHFEMRIVMKGLLPSSININKNKRSKREKERWRARKGKKSNFLSNFHNCLYNFCHTIRFFLSHDTLALIVIYGPVYINIFCNYLFVYIVMVHDIAVVLPQVSLLSISSCKHIALTILYITQLLCIVMFSAKYTFK